MAKTEVYGVEIRGKETVSKATKKAEGGLKKLGSAISAAKLKIVAFVAAMYAMVRVIGSAINAYAQQEQAVARLSQALKNQNEFTQGNIDALTDQAAALQKVTIFGDEQIISAQAMLTSFALTTEQLKKMTPRLLDVATMTMKTTGGMMDLEGAAKFVGMALGGQAGRLTQAGIRLNDYQKATFQAANETERFNMLIEIFDQNAAGLAISVGQTATGEVDKLKNAMFDLNEQFGKGILKMFSKDVKLLIQLAEELKNREKELNEEEEKAGFWRKESAKSTEKLTGKWKLLDIAMTRAKKIVEESKKGIKEMTPAQIALGHAIEDQLVGLQNMTPAQREAFYAQRDLNEEMKDGYTKQENMNKILNDAKKIAMGKTEAERLEIQTLLDLTTEAENYRKEILKGIKPTDEQIKKYMELIAKIWETKDAYDNLTNSMKTNREEMGMVMETEGAMISAPRAVVVRHEGTTPIYGAPNSDEV